MPGNADQLMKENLPVNGPRPANPTDFYNQLFLQLPDFIRFTLEETKTDQFKNSVQLLSRAQRIFCTGSGSSLAAAQGLAFMLQTETKYPAAFVQTSVLLENKSLHAGDVVVLVSHGLNRPDAILIGKACEKQGVKLICITGHPETEIGVSADAALKIYPPYERLFCRPVSPITSYSMALALCMALQDIEIDSAKIMKLIEEGMKAATVHIDKNRHYIILSSGAGTAAATQMCLALREGAGIQAEAYEIESYGHGWYVPDQKRGDSLSYILLEHSQDSQSQIAAKRIASLLANTDTIRLSSQENGVYGNIFLLTLWSKTIGAYLEESGYDFNNPKGMKENFPFHDLTSSWNTYGV